MRGQSPSRLSSKGNAWSRKSAANSLFWKILPASHLEPRFCGRKSGSPARNYHKFNILRAEIRKKEIVCIVSATEPSSLTNADASDSSPLSVESAHSFKQSSNSLFRKILHVSLSDSRFCGHQCISPARNSNETNILREVIRKIFLADHTLRASIPAPPHGFQLTAAPAPSPCPRPEHFFRSASSSRRSCRSSPTWPSRCCGVRATCGRL